MSALNGQFAYDLPIIPTDLRPEETIHQICDALQHLKTVSQDVFGRLSKRISENREKLAGINSRIIMAKEKIDALKGVNKATKVFSSAKYPNADVDVSYSRIYTSGTCVKLERSPHKIQSKHVPVTEEVLRDKLKSFDTPMHLNITMKKNLDHGEGLGRLPQNISSVSSLLLFNTSENPYKKYVILDPLGVVTKTRKEEVDEGLPDAPRTIMQHEEMHRQMTENYSYMPGMGDVPEIAVPDFLPDLAGVADDLLYSADLGPSIAPSVPAGTIPELPEFAQDDVLPTGPLLSKGNSTPAPPEPPPDLPAPASSVPPPPPPPPPAVEPPPPPPPLPPTEVPVPLPPPTAGQVDNAKPDAGMPPSDSTRASLLESIRQAGGVGKVKLRSAKERKIAVKKQKQEEKDCGSLADTRASGGGDLMSDLTAKLLLRRKGISGTVKPGEKSADSVQPMPNKSSKDAAMDRISAMIPPPSGNKTLPDDEEWS